MNRRGRGRGRGRGRSRRAAASVRRGRRRRRVRKASSRMTVTETGCRSRPPTGVARDSGAASSRWASSRFFRGSSAGLGVGRARGWVSDRLRCGDPGATRRARVMRTRWRVRASPSHASARRTCGRRRRRAGLGRVAQAKDRASARERGRRGAYRAGWTSSRRARGNRNASASRSRASACAPRATARPLDALAARDIFRRCIGVVELSSAFPGASAFPRSRRRIPGDDVVREIEIRSAPLRASRHSRRRHRVLDAPHRRVAPVRSNSRAC